MKMYPKLKMWIEQPKNALQLPKTFDTLKEVKEFVGIELLSSPSKMAEYGFSMPATRCKAGSKMAKVKGTVCYDCYALKGRYTFPVVINAMQRRLQAIETPTWVSNMVELIGKKAEKVTPDKRFFRWHDSGDIQNSKHLLDMLEIAHYLPDVKFWLPTKEYGLIRQLLKSDNVIPGNMCVRVSAPDVNGFLDSKVYGPVSAVTDDLEVFNRVSVSFPCHATAPTPDNLHKCGTCRACWNNDIKSVTYFKH